ncbi:hypothetical protein RLDS_25885 [Sphingobium lactosutens DS20]|uniref:Uncharacterized protein n=1 Tax=Sphingobium lactosutens DS20 TaxID=1331060 RepID=T0H3E3_9SPHN|nr:hypothetical protein RLDS_25885 [Sphingobium lactosutens DS20]
MPILMSLWPFMESDRVEAEARQGFTADGCRARQMEEIERKPRLAAVRVQPR